MEVYKIKYYKIEVAILLIYLWLTIPTRLLIINK